MERKYTFLLYIVLIIAFANIIIYNNLEKFTTQYILTGASFLRVFIVILGVNIAKKQGRNGWEWGVYIFILPLISLVILGLTRENWKNQPNLFQRIGKKSGQSIYSMKKQFSNSGSRAGQGDNSLFRIYGVRVSSVVEASIFHRYNEISVSIPIKKVMYMFSHPLGWDDIDALTIDKEKMGEFADEVFKIWQNDPQTLAEILLKIVGKHPNPMENDTVKRMLEDRDFAIRITRNL